MSTFRTVILALCAIVAITFAEEETSREKKHVAGYAAAPPYDPVAVGGYHGHGYGLNRHHHGLTGPTYGAGYPAVTTAYPGYGAAGYGAPGYGAGYGAAWPAYGAGYPAAGYGAHRAIGGYGGYGAGYGHAVHPGHAYTGVGYAG